MKASQGWLIAAIAIVIVICCCFILGVSLLGGGLFAVKNVVTVQSDIVITLMPALSTPTPVATVEIRTQPVEDDATENLKRLQSVDVKISDPNRLAYEFGLTDTIQETSMEPPIEYQVGDQETFWAFDNDTNQPYQVEAQLGCKRDHLYFWIGVDVDYSDSDLSALCDSFENAIYPTNHENFGTEWTPGVDNDPHVYVLFARGMGSVGGYFSSSDEYLTDVHEYSNAHEIIFVSADYNTLDAEYTYGVLAHEFQHMIHFYQDTNEDGWVNEGFAELASLLNHFDPGGNDYIFLNNPDWQLNTWSDDPDLTRANYGASFLFISYFFDRFGEDITRQLVSEPGNGFEGIDTVLERNSVKDELTAQDITADDFFADWVITNYLNDASVSDGRYKYVAYAYATTADPTESIYTCPTDWQDRSVAQYGTDYISIECPGEYHIEFMGSSTVDLLPAQPYSGNYAYWSNRGDDSNMTLTRTFDLTGVSGPVEMTFWTWYDIEQDYDYLYVEASVDGEHWTILKTPGGTDYDPSGNSYGWGFNGASLGWTQELVDLGAFAGQQVQVRFDYVTDPAVNGEGFIVDDIQIPQISYFSDFEVNDGGWVADGFVRISEHLPQTFRVSVIKNSGKIDIEKYAVNPGDTLNIKISDIDETVLVVSGTTRFTRMPSTYKYRIVQD
ncbi:MAG: hypothetical protein ABFD58_05815 [Anaerolineaceae bacterium]